jgi:hypothetical protein
MEQRAEGREQRAESKGHGIRLLGWTPGRADEKG